MNLDSIIFDLDGTLWDSTDVVLKAWNATLKSFSLTRGEITRKDMEGIMGLQVHEIGPKLFPEIPLEESVKLVKYCCEKERGFLLKEGGNLYPNLEEVLETLYKKYQLFIVSNCECGYIETFLEYNNFYRYFRDIECAGNTGKSKGENIKLIVERNNLKSTVYVGDTQGDSNAAKYAGVPFVYASYGFGAVSEYDYIISDISNIISLIDCNK